MDKDGVFKGLIALALSWIGACVVITVILNWLNGGI